jgi:plastocyanin
MSRLSIAFGVLASVVAGPATAQEKTGDRPVTAAELARVREEVKELRQMLIQALQADQQRYDLLLRLIQTGGSAALPPAKPIALPEATPVADPAPRTGTVAGAVEVKGATDQPIYVYVENYRASPAKGRSLEIVQKDKQFSPQISVVPRGTAVYFPNTDHVAHNVFSLSKRNVFDLGILRAGEKGRSVTMAEPGVVEVFCDIHSKMWAEILVAPSALFAKVGADGKFRLANVPAGERVIAAWTAGGAPVRRTVTVGPGGVVDARLVLPVSARATHNNKLGQPYGSYAE